MVTDDDLHYMRLRFTEYAETDSQSDPDKADRGIMPSTDGQTRLAQLLSTELTTYGLTDNTVDQNGYLRAVIPASTGMESVPPFGLCAHLDTASDAPGTNVKAIQHANWDGSPITLPSGLVLDPATDPELAACVGHTIITSDGTTLLGADDKAGIAAIMALTLKLLKNPSIPHGPIEILFTPDEETGHGMDKVPLDRLISKAFYTVDGGAVGEIEAECFNAWKCQLTFNGKAAHLGSARGKMISAVSMASFFVSSLPPQESPETTDGYEGYFCPLEISGTVENAHCTVFLRDFETEGMNRRLERIDALAEAVRARFPGGTVTLEKTRQYLNMKDKLRAEPHVLERLEKAATRAGVTVIKKPIRGGTDGSRLTEMGIPTPNIFTGGHNYHSRSEWASIEQMGKTVETLIQLAIIWGEDHVQVQN